MKYKTNLLLLQNMEESSSSGVDGMTLQKKGTQSPAICLKSQLDQQLSLHKFQQINKKNEWINIFLYCEFAQNELKVL